MNHRIADDIWQQHKEWSAAANHLKASITGWRKALLSLAVAGAILSTLSTQFADGTAQKLLAWLGAACLAVIPVLTPRKLSARRTRDWTRVRSVSEALKSELYAYFAVAGAYAERETSARTLLARGAEITGSASDLVRELAKAKPDESPPPVFARPEDYLVERVDDQVRWYKDKAAEHQRLASILRGFELALAITAAMLAATAGAWGETLVLGGMSIEFGAWVAVFTTLGGTLSAHLGASRYDHLVTSYSATAHQLRILRHQWPPADGSAAPSPAWSEFVRQCEDAISKENESWVAKLAKNAQSTA